MKNTSALCERKIVQQQGPVLIETLWPLRVPGIKWKIRLSTWSRKSRFGRLFLGDAIKGNRCQKWRRWLGKHTENAFHTRVGRQIDRQKGKYFRLICNTELLLVSIFEKKGVYWGMKWRCVVWHFWHLTISPSLYYNFTSYRVDWTGLHIVLDCNSPFVCLKWQVMKNGKNPGETNCWIVHFRLFWSIRFVKRVASIPSHEIFVSSCFLVPGVGMGKKQTKCILSH